MAARRPRKIFFFFPLGSRVAVAVVARPDAVTPLTIRCLTMRGVRPRSGAPARGAVPAVGARAPATGGPRAATENQPVERRDDRESLTGRIALSARCRRACPAPPAILFFLPSGRAIELLRLLAPCLSCLGRLATCFLLPSALRRLSHPCLPDPHWPADCKFRYKTFLTHSLLFTCICIRWFRIIS